MVLENWQILTYTSSVPLYLKARRKLVIAFMLFNINLHFAAPSGPVKSVGRFVVSYSLLLLPPNIFCGGKGEAGHGLEWILLE